MLSIDEMTLRVPGLRAAEARDLGNEVSRYVADGLEAPQKDGTLGSLDLQVKIPPGTRRSRMAKLIAEAILKGLA